MKTAAAGILVICGLLAGLQQSTRLRMRERELMVFLNALISLKSAAAYTGGDLRALLRLCADNAFLQRIPSDADLPAAWKAAAENYFTDRQDRALAEAFIAGYGQTDLSGLLSYISLFETRAQAALSEAKQDAASRCRLYTVLGLFAGTVTALVLI